MSRQLERLWSDDIGAPQCLGCSHCPDVGTCGGLFIAGGNTFDCTSSCCNNPRDCNYVCRRNSDYTDRLREVDGLTLDNIARAKVVGFPILRPAIPHIYHPSRRTEPFLTPVVSLPLYPLIDLRRGTVRFRSRRDLLAYFKVGYDCKVVLSGVDQDIPLERWWALGAKRTDVIRALKDLDIACVTSPNFSVFADVPRWDNLHSMKRIGICWQEFTSAGIPTALHLNARTDTDWQNWEQFVITRPEIAAVSFEYATGAGWKDRMKWHTKKLVALGQRAGRGLRIIVRGGALALPELEKGFEAVTFIDTASFMKTMKRQRAVQDADGFRWQSDPYPPNQPLDELLAFNAAMMENRILKDHALREGPEHRTEIKNPFKQAS